MNRLVFNGLKPGDFVKPMVRVDPEPLKTRRVRTSTNTEERVLGHIKRVAGLCESCGDLNPLCKHKSRIPK